MSSEIRTDYIRLALTLYRSRRYGAEPVPEQVVVDVRELILANRKVRHAAPAEVSAILTRLAAILQPYGIRPALDYDGVSLVLILPAPPDLKPMRFMVPL